MRTIKQILETFDKFYDDNEHGGSSRWMVSPNTVRSYLRNALEEVVESIRPVEEIYIGMEGFKPQTAPEAYQQQVLKEMYDAIQEWKADVFGGESCSECGGALWWEGHEENCSQKIDSAAKKRIRKQREKYENDIGIPTGLEYL